MQEGVNGAAERVGSQRVIALGYYCNFVVGYVSPFLFFFVGGREGLIV